jgi:putative FmdB family regulatory protein
MPIYEYKCDQGHTFEVMQRMTDEPVGTCQTCNAPVHRVFHPVAVHFKGSGFYNTDYGTRKRARETAETSKSEGSSAKTTSGTDSAKSEGKGSSGSASSDKKSETKTASSSD